MLLNPYRFGIPVAPNPAFSNVVMLLGFEGSDGSTTIIDESSYARTMTAAGNAQIDTAVALIGTSSALYDGSGDRIQAAASANFDIGTQPFCLELFIRYAATTGNPAIASQWQGVSNNASQTWIFDYFSGALRFLANNNSVNASRTWAASIGTRYHVAVSRDGSNNLRFFVDGTQLGASAAFSANIASSTSPLQLGVHINTSNPFNGWQDEVRFTIGEPVYTTNFIPPTGAFPRS